MKKKTSVKIPQLASFTPCLTLSEVTANFVAKQSQKKARDGDNEHLKDFLSLATMLCQNYKTFSFQDALSLTRALDFPANKLSTLFNAWIDELTASKRVRTEASVYDYKQFTFQ